MQSGSKERPILMTTDSVGGVWHYSLSLISELADHGLPVVLAVMGRRLNKSQQWQVAKLKNVELRESDFPLEWMDRPWSEIDRAAEWLQSLAANYHVRLVHLNQLSFGAVEFSVPRIVVAHSCVYSWYLAVRQVLPDHHWCQYYRRVAAGLRSAEVVVSPTEGLLTKLQSLYGEFRNCRVIPNGVALESWQPRDKQEYLFSAGRLWDEAKNFKVLDRAALHIRWPIIVAGEHVASSRESLQFANLQLLGNCAPETMRIYQGRASIFVAPVYYEPFGLAILEAAACGCALVLGDIPTLREVWGGAAFYVDPDEPQMVAHKINQLINSPQRLKEFSRLARTRAQLYPQSKMGTQYIKLYQSMITPDLKSGVAL